MKAMQLVLLLSCTALIMQTSAAYMGETTQNSPKINKRWIPHHSRVARSPSKNRDKETDKQLKIISKLMTNLKKRSDCSSGNRDLASHCQNHWLPEALLRLSVRVAGRNNKHNTKRGTQISNQHIRINKLMEKLTDVTDCAAEDAKEDAAQNKETIKLDKLKVSVKDNKTDYEETGDGDTQNKTITVADNESGDTDGAEATEDDVAKDGQEVENEDKSECDYSHFESSHSMLLPPNDCKINQTGITEKDGRDILLFHNSLRARVARGEETEGNPGPQPPAADMRELVWNDQLAEVAEAWAKQCKTGHDQPGARKICSRNYYIGQNLHFYYGFDPEPDWEVAVNAWYKEVKDLPSDLVSSFRSLKPIKIGHYTQVVWAETTEVGCGIVHYEGTINGKVFPESKIYACNYGSAGNVKTLPIYMEGTTASQCPLGKSKHYPDLCAPDTKIEQ